MAYCTPTDLQELGYSWDASDNANIIAICDTASRLVDAYCKQTFAQGTVTEIHQARVRDNIIKVFPLNMTVVSVASIVFMYEPYVCTNPQYVSELGYIRATTNAANGNYLVSITYNYGFADGHYPADLVKATVLAASPLLDDYFLSKDSNVSMVKSIEQGKLRIERQDTDKLPQNAIDILNGGNNGLGYVRVRAS